MITVEFGSRVGWELGGGGGWGDGNECLHFLPTLMLSKRPQTAEGNPVVELPIIIPVTVPMAPLVNQSLTSKIFVSITRASRHNINSSGRQESTISGSLNLNDCCVFLCNEISAAITVISS